MSKFSVGDKVKVTNPIDYEKYKGRKGQIICIHDKSPAIQIKYFNYSLHYSHDDIFYEKELTKIGENMTYKEYRSNQLNIEPFIRDRIQLYIAKNKDYGNSFDKSLDKHGEIAYIVRADDKINRFNTLLNKDQEVDDENIKDTVIDLFSYTAMFRFYQHGANEIEDLISIMRDFTKDNFENYFNYLNQFDLEGFNKEEMKEILLIECS